MNRLLSVVAASLLAVCCMPVQAVEPAEESAQACWLKAFKAADADAVTRCYAPDAVLWIPGGAMAQGSQAIHDAYAGFFADYGVKSVDIKTMASQTVGDDAVSWGTFSLVAVAKKDGAEITEVGRFTELSKRIDGRWLYVVDHASDDPAPAEASPKAVDEQKQPSEAAGG